MDEALLRIPIRLPDLGVDNDRVRLSVWLVAVGTRVSAGDRVVEILTGEAVVDLSAPTHGVLAEKLVPEDSKIKRGQLLGWVEQIKPS